MLNSWRQNQTNSSRLDGNFMKKLITSAGVAAFGVSGLQARDAPGFTRTQTERPWTVSSTIRAFYDDNYRTFPKGMPSSETFGFEVSPAVRLALPLGQTFIGTSYNFSGRYFDGRQPDQWDYSHEFDVRLDHRFSERFELNVTDSFVISSEPTVLDSFSGIITAPTRATGGSQRNAANIKFSAQLTRLLGLVLGYGNNLYSYEQTGIGSRSALLDRMEHAANLDVRFQVASQFVGIVGCQYGVSKYSGDTPLYMVGTFPGPYTEGPLSSIRDSQSHYGYVGAEYSFNSKLTGAIRVGIQSTAYDSFSNSSLSPYVDLSMAYTYKAGCSMQAGFKHSRNSTEIAAPVGAGNVGQPTLDQETSAVFGSITHQITRSLTGSLISQYQMSTFNGGAANNGDDNLWLVGLNFEYRINPHLAVELGYNYDTLESALANRSFSRNRVYMGVRATY